MRAVVQGNAKKALKRDENMFVKISVFFTYVRASDLTPFRVIQIINLNKLNSV